MEALFWLWLGMAFLGHSLREGEWGKGCWTYFLGVLINIVCWAMLIAFIVMVFSINKELNGSYWKFD
jgi:hypothetical protein